MQVDEVVWEVINHQFCSFKTKVARERTFCQNPYNVSGLCIRSACPLANSRYATIREEEGVCYLYMKTAERAHTPKHLWEKIKLPANYTKALTLVSEQLEHFPKYLVHRNKQRLTKIHQMLIRMRKLKLKAKPKITTTNAKVDKREKGREQKALAAAQLDRAIENELLERLKQVSENEIYNYPEQQYKKVLSREAAANDEEEEEEEEEDEDYELEGEEEDEEEEEYNVEYVEDFEESDDEEEIEEAANSLALAKLGKRKLEIKGRSSSSSSSKRTGKGTRVEVEYEEEDDEDERTRVRQQEQAVSAMDFNF